MTRHISKKQVLASAAIRAGWAGALLILPGRLLGASASSPIPGAAVAVVRVLGVRHLLQAVVIAAAPRGPVAGLGALADTAHTGTCLALAAVSPRWRRAALLDAAVEAGLTAAAWQMALPWWRDTVSRN